MQPIPFRQHPALVSATDGLSLAFEHLLGNLRVWALPALAYAVITGTTTAVVVQSLIQELPFAPTDQQGAQAAAQRMAEVMLARVPSFIALGVFLLIASVALTWLLLALAVGGLPGRRMTFDTAISAGVRSIGAWFVYGLLIVGVVPLLVVALVVAGGAGRGGGQPWVFLLLLVAIVPGWIYVSVRLSLVFYAVFDGAGPIDAFRRSWALTQGAVLRVVGWSLIVWVVSVGVSIVTSFASTPMMAVPVAGIIFSTIFSTAFQAFQVVYLAILYESQRMRLELTAPGAVAPVTAVAPPPFVESAAPPDPSWPQPPPPPPPQPPAPGG